MNWALALLSAALLVLCYPSFDWRWLAPVALAPMVFAAARELRWRWRFLQGYAAGVLYWFWVCNWIHSTIETHGGMSAATAWFVFALFCLAKAFQFGAFALVAGWLMNTRLAVAATAALWVLIEYSNAPMGFAWLMLGNAGIDWPVLPRLAPVAGVWGLSFLFAAIACEIANLCLRRSRRGWAGIGLAALLACVLLPRLPAKAAARERAVMVQPNIDETVQWTQGDFNALLRRMAQLSIAPANARPQPALLVWPEAPAPFYDDDPGFIEYLQNLAEASHADLIAGMVAHAPDKAILNSAVVVNRDGAFLSRYDKVNLVPFGEYVPLGLGPIAFKISTESGEFRPGTKQVVTAVDGHKLAIFICYESVFPRFISRFAARGAQVLVNPSNDGWFAKTAARFQHLEIVRMRAVENGRWVLRATNDGITAAIDPAGQIRERLPLYRETSAALGFNYRDTLTLYTRWGDWFVIVCVLLVLAAIVQLQPWRMTRTSPSLTT